jgi:hypothetical protein
MRVRPAVHAVTLVVVLDVAAFAPRAFPSIADATAASAGQGAASMSHPSTGTDRPAPPDVQPVLHDGVRYEQDLGGHEPSGSAPGGTLAAYDAGSGKLLWRLQVYTVRSEPGAPASHPGRYFRTMTLGPAGDVLEIEDEVGGHYRVDLAHRTVQRVGGPPQGSTPTAPARPKPKP